MNREQKNLVQTLKNITTSPAIKLKFRQIANVEWYWALSADGKQVFYVRRTSDVSSGHLEFNYLVKYKNVKTKDKDVGAKIFPLAETEYNKHWLKTKRRFFFSHGK